MRLSMHSRSSGMARLLLGALLVLLALLVAGPPA